MAALYANAGHHDRGLPDVFRIEPLDGIHVRVVRPHVVVGVLLNRIEARHTGIDEAQMIG